MLLVTGQTPRERTTSQRARLARMFTRPVEEIKVLLVDATREAPSALVGEYNVWLFADASVAFVSPDSTVFARDWAEKWFLPHSESAQANPLYRCKLKPRR
jgi:hypothetical protein